MGQLSPGCRRTPLGPHGADTAGKEAGSQSRRETRGHMESRAEGGGRGPTSLGCVVSFHPKCHFLPEAFSEAPVRTGWVPGRGDGGQVVSQGSGCRASNEDDFTFNHREREGGRIV